MKHFLIILCTLACSLGMNAQEQKVLTGTFWDNWFVQAGLDMSLQNPYGCDFSEVFPKGKTFGVDVALGKWFTPHVALRGKVNWENGLSIFKNKHLEWVGPADDPQSNMDKGGYAVFCVDVPISVKKFSWIITPTRSGISMSILGLAWDVTSLSILLPLQWVSAWVEPISSRSV